MSRFEIPIIEPVIRGDYERIKFELKQAKEVDTDPDEPQNISGWSLRFTAKEYLETSDFIVQKSTANTGDFEIEDASLGVGYIVLEPDDLLPLTYETSLICDIEATDIEGKPFTTRFYLPVELGVSD